MEKFKTLLYTIRWFVTYSWDNKKSRGTAIEHVSKALTLTRDEGDMTALYTLRWYFTNKWGEGTYNQYDCIDIITELIDDVPTHIDYDMVPNKDAIVDPEEEELKNYTPEVKSPVIKKGIKVGLAVGHNRYTGASSYEGDDEWTTRKEVTLVAHKTLADFGVESKIFIRDRSLGYGSAMRKHGSDMKDFGSMVNVEMHFNSADSPKATGTEMIVSTSKSGEYFKPLCKYFANEFDLPVRGDEGIQLRPTGRGSGFCRYTPNRSGVWEPCFSSNPSEWEKFDDEYKKEGEAFAFGLLECLENSYR